MVGADKSTLANPSKGYEHTSGPINRPLSTHRYVRLKKSKLIITSSVSFLAVLSLNIGLACNNKDNPFTDVGGMVANSFKLVCNPKQICGTL